MPFLVQTVWCTKANRYTSKQKTKDNQHAVSQPNIVKGFYLSYFLHYARSKIEEGEALKWSQFLSTKIMGKHAQSYSKASMKLHAHVANTANKSCAGKFPFMTVNFSLVQLRKTMKRSWNLFFGVLLIIWTSKSTKFARNATQTGNVGWVSPQ